MKIIVFLIMCIFTVNSYSSANDEKFEGYTIKEFVFEGKNAKIVFPKNNIKGNHWLWRARFWGSHAFVDKALLEKGFHIVYIDISGSYGNNEAVELWNNFYDYIIKEYKLNPKVVLEGMSRGGLMIYNWAAENTDKVACIYADAPMLQLSNLPDSGDLRWEDCYKAYGLNKQTAINFKDDPLNKAEIFAKAGIPLIHVCGDADEIVPMASHTEPFVKKIKEYGGSIEVIVKRGIGHHPHSLEDPTPIVNFIMENLKK